MTNHRSTNSPSQQEKTCCDGDCVSQSSPSQQLSESYCSDTVKTRGSATSPSTPNSTEQTEQAGYYIYRFVSGWIDSTLGKIPQVTTTLKPIDHVGHWAMRWGVGRSIFRITPGIYAVGFPCKTSPLLVSANYKFSFDCLRSALKGVDAWVLVIDTKGINVWCAAGKGTFGTEEIVRRCKQHQPEQLVSHRTIILPQLAAPGVAGYKVEQETGFKVIYGPIKAADLKQFLAADMKATEQMRKVNFTFWDRIVLTPVEISGLSKYTLYFCFALFLLSGIGADVFSFSAAWHRGIAAIGATLTGVISGCVLTPAFLPWLPARSFAAKGAMLGIVPATILALGPYKTDSIGAIVALFLLIASISSFTAMNFTGSTTYTSQSGVEKEMRFALPCQGLAMFVAALLWIVAAF